MANFITDVGINPDKGMRGTQKPRTLIAKYGDGYEQRASAGIHTEEESWDLTWTNRTLEEGNKIILFLEVQGGTTAFDWYPEGYQISSTTTGTNTDRLIDTSVRFTRRYLDATVTNTTDGTTALVDSVCSCSELILTSDIMTSGEDYTIYPYKKYVCEQWTTTLPVNGTQTISAKFRRVFEP